VKNTMKVSAGSRSFRCLAAVAAVSVGLSLAACSSDDDSDGDQTTTAAETSATQATALPTVAELNGVINRAVDPAVPSDQKVDTVQGGDQATELFDVMTRSKEETGATVEVVDPVLPGILPDTVNATVNFNIPNSDPMPVTGVEFVKENGVWKLTREWACTLIQNVAPDQVPPLCSADPAGELPAESAPAPAPEGEGAPAPEGEGAPAPAPAPEGEGAPAPAPAPEGAPAAEPAPAA
jgi:hypothetical protein